MRSWTAWDGTSVIEAPAGSYLYIVEADSNYKAVAAGCVVVPISG